MGEELYRGLKVGKYEVLTQLSAGRHGGAVSRLHQGAGRLSQVRGGQAHSPRRRRTTSSFVKMFLDEARITAAFNHPNIGQVFDLESDEEGLYLAMEFIAGQNLNQVDERLREEAGRAARLASRPRWRTTSRSRCTTPTPSRDPAGKSFPVIHRDVAQKNIMVTYDGVVKLLDFGIAKARGSLGRTTVGTVKGTTGYMSPEQVRGEDARRAQRRVLARGGAVGDGHRQAALRRRQRAGGDEADSLGHHHPALAGDQRGARVALRHRDAGPLARAGRPLRHRQGHGQGDGAGLPRAALRRRPALRLHARAVRREGGRHPEAARVGGRRAGEGGGD